MTCGTKEQKETVMFLQVDLDCESCYRKVKRVLCKFPQIRNQVYDKKNNTVIITVFCCSPEKIRDKLCCKAGKSIKSIEIKQQPKPKPNPAPAETEKFNPKPAPEPQKPPEMVQKNGAKKDAPAAEPAPGPPPQKPAPGPPPQKPAPGPPPQKPDPKPAPQPTPKIQEPEAQWVPGYPPCQPPPMVPTSACCAPCYDGRPGPPCYHYWRPGPPYPYGYYVRPLPPRPYYGSCCEYFNEENPASCSVM